MQQQEICADAAQRCVSRGVELDDKSRSSSFVNMNAWLLQSGACDEIQMEDSNVVEEFCSETCMDQHRRTVLKTEGVELPQDLGAAGRLR